MSIPQSPSRNRIEDDSVLILVTCYLDGEWRDYDQYEIDRWTLTGSDALGNSIDVVGKNGIIKDAKIHETVIETVVNMANGLGFSTIGLTSSPIKGGHGNIEFLLHLTKNAEVIDQVTPQIKTVVADAHGELDEKK